MGMATKKRRALPWLLGMALATAAVPGQATPNDPAVWTRVLSEKSGVASEAETIINAPAEQVAELVGDPHNFVPLFPAKRIEILESSPKSQVVSVEMQKPWPVGTVRWVEDVVVRKDPEGHLFEVERNAHTGGYFRRLHARWRITPARDAEKTRCMVTYHVSMELMRWVPEWMLRKGNLSGMLDTLARLRTLAEGPKGP